MKKLRLDKRAHEECGAKADITLLQFVPAEEETLTADSRRDDAKVQQSGILLARILRDALHDKVEDLHPVLLVVEGTLSVFTNVQSAKQSLDNYLTIFNVNVEQINAHEGRP